MVQRFHFCRSITSEKNLFKVKMREIQIEKEISLWTSTGCVMQQAKRLIVPLLDPKEKLVCIKINYDEVL